MVGREADQAEEIAALRAEIRDLQAQLVEQAARANSAVAAAEDRTYWLDRWHLDLNALMRRPGARRAHDALLSLARWARRLRRALPL